MDEQMIELTPIAAAVVDIWMGGDQAWRARLHDSDFLESADWQNAMEIARAAHSVIAGKVAELEEAAAQAKACLGSGFGDHPIEAIRESNINRAWHLLDAALAPHPKGIE